MAVALVPAFAAEPAAAQDFASHTLVKFDCNPGYDPSTGNAQAAFDNCQTPAGGINFTIAGQNGDYPGSTQTTDGGGQTGWSDIPLGTAFTVTESVPAGYGDPWVYCEVTGNPDLPGDTQTSFFQAAGGTMNVGITDPSLTSYTQSTCYWFNTPPGDALQVGTTVSIEKRLCDERFDPTGASLEDLYANCGDFPSGVPFILNNDVSTEQQTDAQGRTTFEGVPTGPVRIHELKGLGYVPIRVYCQSHPTADANVVYESNNETPFTEQEGAWYVDTHVNEGEKIDCIWFNGQEPTFGTVYAYKYNCPAGFDYEGGSRDYLFENCTETPDIRYQPRCGIPAVPRGVAG